MTHLAYLDPGSASILLQMIAGGLAAVAVTLGVYWRRLLRFLHITRRDQEPRVTPPSDAR